MKRKIIAAQLYTIRDFCKTATEFAQSMKKIKKSGFEAVQVSGVGPIEPTEIKRILDGEGLYCCATHESGKMIVEEPEKVVEKLKVLDCRYTAYPYPHNNPRTKQDYIELAKSLDRAGKILAKNDMVLTYHNHALEFERFDSKTGLDIIYDDTNPKYLQGEIDTFWIQHGGESPVEWCKKLRGRLPLIHLKEFGIIENKITTLEIGNGNLNWKAIVKEAKKSGCEWFIIEQDNCRIDPFDSLKMSLDYLMEEV